MGTLKPTQLRFPVPGETLAHNEPAGRHKGPEHSKEGEVGGERRTDNEDIGKQQETPQHEPSSPREGESKTTDPETSEIRTKEPSHDPGGSWLTKVLGTRDRNLKTTLGKGTGEG
ncbi:hypothetical protein NDU88_006433 [Pleurodeles waltl]|uniref:Uncharacterized protein n=1 Tax=Pleurodeles waltl TaxID=8319 RepID=A0AAV7VPR0_PLEWA|nr:hypothetical protein NDU88_006433 [Pleurodeles waltl]